MAFQVGDRVELISSLPSHPWTAQLVGNEGEVLQIKSEHAAGVRVAGLMEGEPLWFSANMLGPAKAKDKAS